MRSAFSFSLVTASAALVFLTAALSCARSPHRRHRPAPPNPPAKPAVFYAASKPPVDERQAARLKDEWGVEIVSARPASAGLMIDFRFRVLDPNKASSLLRKEAKPSLVDEKTGMKLGVPVKPKIGSLRQKASPPEAGRIYFMFFANSFGLVQDGSLVTVEIGSFRAEHVRVEGPRR